MKTKNQYLPLITSILITGVALPSSFAQETKVKPSPTKFQIVVPEEKDQLIAHLKASIVAPLNKRMNTRKSFSRSVPEAYGSYHLVETTPKGASEQRLFTVVHTKRLLYKTKGEKKPASESKDVFKLRHEIASGQTLVDLGGKWVAFDQHPLLQFFVKEKSPTIVP